MFCPEAQYPSETLCRAQYFGAIAYCSVSLVKAGITANEELDRIR